MAYTRVAREWAYNLPGRIGLAGLLLLLAVGGCSPRQQGEGAQEPGGSETLPLTAAGTLPLAGIQGTPDQYIGKPVSGTGAVAEVVGERGFWVEADATQVFVVKDEPVVKEPALKEGQRVSLEGSVHDTKKLSEVPAAMKLDEETRRMLDGQPAFIVATSLQLQAP